MVEAARRAYAEFPTVVNEIPESSLSYNNTMSDYAHMDNIMQSAQKSIGGASDSAQLAQSFMWDKIYRGELDEEYQQLYENVVILAVLAQVAIDGCKRLFAVNPEDEIKRIRAQRCMNREKDYPKFMKYTHKISVAKNGKDRPLAEVNKDRERINKRIDYNIVTPMNWLQECLDKLKDSKHSKSIDIMDMLVENNERGNYKHMSKVKALVEEYDSFCRRYIVYKQYDDDLEMFKTRTDELIEKIRSMRLGFNSMYNLIKICFGVTGVEEYADELYKGTSKYATRMLNILYLSNKENFLKCFKPAPDKDKVVFMNEKP